MPIEVTSKAGQNVGVFGSVDEAKASLPQVREWRADESRELGWNGWVGDVPFSEPDYKITHVTGGKGGFVRDESDRAAAIVSDSGRRP